jgi:CheY-like chemotaxis protein
MIVSTIWLVTPVSPKTVLVVEDDSSLRELYRSALVSAGYSVVAVEDGMDALRRVERDAPQAVVLDMALPRLGGRDVQRELKSRPETSKIPIVVVSGTDISDLNESEYASVLRKPIHADAVVYAVDKCFRRQQRSTALLF